MKVRPAAATLLLPLVLVLAACAETPVDPGDGGGIDHATTPDHVLVRISSEGGFTPVEWTYTNFPVYSLFGDGTLVVPGAQIEIYPGPALPAISSRQVDEAGIQAILEEAIAAVEDVPADLNDLGYMSIADATTTVITVSAGGVDRTIRAYALSEQTERPDGMPQREYEARLRLQELVTKLTGSTDWMPEGSVGPEGTYVASAARLFVGDYRPVEGPGAGAGAVAARRRPRRLRRPGGPGRIPVRRRAGRGLGGRPRARDLSEHAHAMDGCGSEVLDPVPSAVARRDGLLSTTSAVPPARLRGPVKSRPRIADEFREESAAFRGRCGDP